MRSFHSTLKEIVEDTLNKINKNHELIFLITEKLNPIFKKRIVEGYRLAHYKAPSKNSRRCIIYATAYLITLSECEKIT